MIGKTIRYIRQKKEFKQEQIAAILGVRSNTISQYENETRQMTFETIEKIASNCDYKIFFIKDKTGDKFQVKDLKRKDM